MEELLKFTELNYANTTYVDFMIGLVLLIFLSLFLKKCYEKFSLTVSTKENFSVLLPIFSIAIYVIVLSIKSSIVLSLGLVGALSIIRMRTAIKEIEQIIYLLIMTAISISVAAGVYYYGIILSFLLYIYYAYQNKKRIKDHHFQNDILVLKLNKLDTLVLDTIIDTIKKDNNIVIQSISSDSNVTSIVFKIDGITTKLIRDITEFFNNHEEVNVISLNVYNSIG
ncbi:DUF4956 domain-containing protein [Flavobacteriaceae bacterium]|nr:DUF4956 domain-containing protein [Flavobacteriaceae bacterium]